MTLMYCHSEPPNVIPNPPLVIPNGVRNLKSLSDGWSVTTTVLRVNQHLRFFGVRASE